MGQKLRKKARRKGYSSIIIDFSCRASSDLPHLHIQGLANKRARGSEEQISKPDDSKRVKTYLSSDEKERSQPEGPKREKTYLSNLHRRMPCPPSLSRKSSSTQMPSEHSIALKPSRIDRRVEELKTAVILARLRARPQIPREQLVPRKSARGNEEDSQGSPKRAKMDLQAPPSTSLPRTDLSSLLLRFAKSCVASAFQVIPPPPPLFFSVLHKWSPPFPYFNCSDYYAISLSNFIL